MNARKSKPSFEHLVVNQPYITSLEGWRGIVSVLVMMFHFPAFFSDRMLMPYAYLGVDFFFILSGFIIARRYETPIDRGEVTFRQFAIRRFARLYPLYIASILLFVVVNHYVVQPYYALNFPWTKALDIGMGPEMAQDFLIQLTMLGNLGFMDMPWNGPAWSVSVEWIVNLLFFAAVLKIKRGRNALRWVVVIYCAFYLYGQSPDTLHITYANGWLLNPTTARGLLGFTLGTIIHRMIHTLPLLSPKALHTLELGVVMAAVLLLSYHRSTFVIGADYFLLFCVCVPLIVLCLYRDSWLGKITALPLFLFLGKISYSIYLLHLPLGYFFQFSPWVEALNLPKPWFWIAYTAMVFAVCSLTYRYFELPLRKRGRRYSDRKSAGEAVRAA